MNLITFGHITTCLFVLAIVEINAKSIFINKSTVKIIISENNSSNGIQTSILMDQLYKKTKFRFQIEKKVQDITDKVRKWRLKWNPNLHSAQKLKAKECEDNKR